MTFYKLAISVLALFLLFQSCKKEDPASACQNAVNLLKINEIQTIGSHNSYRIKTDTDILDFLYSVQSSLPANANPNELDYDHVSLTRQLEEFGVRSMELDIYHDPDGGRFYTRTGKDLIGQPEASNIPELLAPGLKLLHIPDIDYNTHHYSFIEGLETIKTWSDNHPQHLPLIIYVEPKTDDLTDIFFHHWSPALPFSANFADSIDLEINAVFGENAEQVITPDEVRGSFQTLEAAVLANNWPTLEEARGKIMFIIDHAMYADGHPSLADRVGFIFANPGEPECAFIIMNDPVANQQLIKDHVASGYMVRTRADAGTWEARNGDYSRMNAAFDSGAQIISTDYYLADERADTSALWSDYEVRFPGGDLARVSSPTDVSLAEGCLILE